MLTKDKLQNIVIFMEKAPHGSGGEARAWAQTLEAVHAELEALAVIAKQPAKEVAELVE